MTSSTPKLKKLFKISAILSKFTIAISLTSVLVNTLHLIFIFFDSTNYIVIIPKVSIGLMLTIAFAEQIVMLKIRREKKKLLAWEILSK